MKKHSRAQQDKLQLLTKEKEELQLSLRKIDKEIGKTQKQLDGLTLKLSKLPQAA